MSDFENEAVLLRYRGKKKNYFYLGHAKVEGKSCKRTEIRYETLGPLSWFHGPPAFILFGQYLYDSKSDSYTLGECMKRINVPGLELTKYFFTEAMVEGVINNYLLTESTIFQWQIDRILKWLGGKGDYDKPPEGSFESNNPLSSEAENIIQFPVQ